MDASGAAIDRPTVADILAQGHATGTEWRVENIGYNALADVKVEKIGLDIVNGAVVDYTVQIADKDGTFYVWARNLDRALALQAKQGDARDYNLRNYEIDFAKIQSEVDSTDDSANRIEVMTPAELNFALQLDSIQFQPEILSASINAATGVVSYSINQYGDSSLSASSYVSGVDKTIGLLDSVFKEWMVVSRGLAARMALQGGLSAFAQGIRYDATLDKYVATTSRQLAPVFEAIFKAAPTENTDNAIAHYLAKWNEILWQIYPDYQISSGDTVSGGSIAFDQVFLMQQIVAAYEAVGVNYDIRGIAHALSVDDAKIVTNTLTDKAVNGTSGIDYFYITGGDHTLSGGVGSDYYFVGKDAGSDQIVDYGRGEINELVFTAARAADITAVREGQDLIISVNGTSTVVRVKDQFLGEMNDYYGDGVQQTSGVDDIVFVDGTVWDRTTLSFIVANARTPDQVVIGSGSADVLIAGPNDYLGGGAGGDIYIYRRGDGYNVIDDQGKFSFGPVTAGLDFLVLKGGISADKVKFTRVDYEGSDSLKINVLDDQGASTDDVIVIKGAFQGAVLNLGAFAKVLGSSAGL
ncbi:Haemolysin-type calcium binding protein related domain-containing protein, partial [Rhodoblastus acidophilus]